MRRRAVLISIYADSRRHGFRRSCQAAIEWAENVKTGHSMPFDGPLVVLSTQGSLLDGERIVQTVDTSITRSHFASCPQAREWRHR